MRRRAIATGTRVPRAHHRRWLHAEDAILSRSIRNSAKAAPTPSIAWQQKVQGTLSCVAAKRSSYADVSPDTYGPIGKRSRLHCFPAISVPYPHLLKCTQLAGSATVAGAWPAPAGDCLFLAGCRSAASAALKPAPSQPPRCPQRA